LNLCIQLDTNVFMKLTPKQIVCKLKFIKFTKSIMNVNGLMGNHIDNHIQVCKLYMNT
jgi:hypothetical protein